MVYGTTGVYSSTVNKLAAHLLDGLHMCIALAHTGLAREPSTRGFRPGMSLFFVQWVVERHGNLGRDGTTFVWLCLVADVLICYEIKILLADW